MVDFHKLRELGFDSENAKERFLGSEEFYFSCMKIYIRANDIAKLTELCRACDWENALECVHTMKGSTGNLALYGLYSHYSAMTDLFRSEEPLKAASMLPEAQEMEEKMRSAAGFYGAPEDV
ncbi:MAG TPA: hypothetical protein DIV52_10195 [Ruminococcaceae bacterium]|nr:hypothetical protein [Oscillospiraceae bacterium]